MEESSSFLESWRPAFPGILPSRKKTRAPKSSRLDAAEAADDNAPFQVFVRFRPGQSSASLSVRQAGPKAARYGDWCAHYHGVFAEGDTQGAVYEVAARRVVSAFLEGSNGAIIAFGQTGTGKTYTMGGLPETSHGAERGIIPRALEDVFAAGGLATCSFLQIYINERVYDLLDGGDAQLKSLEVRDDGIAATVEGLRDVAVSSAEEVLELFRLGARRRATGSTALNDTSSRSHAILTLRRRGCVLQLADLAGSERLAASGAAGEVLEQSKAINGSLLVLARVIAKLTQENGQRASHVPFRDSKLTTLLRECLGGYCRTSLIATLSAANEDEAVRTLRFAARATYVENLVEKETEAKDNEKKSRMLKAESDMLESAQRAAQSAAVVGGVLMVQSRIGSIACNLYGASAVMGRVVLLLHGNPSDSSEMGWIARALQAAGFVPVGVDQPGFGGSAHLPRHSSCHSSRACDRGGPVEVVLDVLNYLGVKKASIFGFDWGGGIGLAFAGQHPRRVNRLVLYHPMYNETPAGELKQLKVPVDLLWVKTDQFHPLKLGKQLEKRIPTCTLAVFDVGRFDPTSYHEAYGRVHPDMAARAIAAFEEAWTSSSKATPKGKPKAKSKAASAPATSPLLPRLPEGRSQGGASSASSACSSASDVSCDEGWSTEDEPDPASKEQKRVVRDCIEAGAALLAESERAGTSVAAAGAWFRRAFKQQALPFFYACFLRKGSMRSRPQLLRIFSNLPVLAPGLTSRDLVSAGVWDEQDALAFAALFPSLRRRRFFAGRSVAVKLPCVSNKVCDKLRAFDGAAVGEAPCRTPCAQITSVTASRVVLQVPTISGALREVSASREHLAEQNNPTVFQPTPCGKGIILEDGIKCVWQSTLLKARLCELAIVVAEVMRGCSSASEVQRQAILAIRRHLNLTCLYDGVDRHRFTSGDVEKLMTFGCCHCHGLSSVMCAALLPFSELLGIDVRYTGGFHVHEGDEQVSNSVERHQWLELTLRPQMETVICDLTLAGCPVDGPRWNPDWLLMPVGKAFGSGGLYANGKSLLGSRTLAAHEEDFYTG